MTAKGILMWLVVGLLASVLTAAASAVEPIAAHAYRLNGEAQTLGARGDLKSAIAREKGALALVPNHPRFLLRLAELEVRSGNRDEARAVIERYAALGLRLNPAAQPALETLLEEGDLQDWASRVFAPPAARGRPRILAQLTNNPIVAEGIVYDQAGHQFLVSTVAARTIYAVRRGKITTFVRPGVGSGGLYGMAIDAERRRLWVSEIAGDGTPGSEGPATTALLEIDSRNGKTLHRYALSSGKAHHQLNDVAIAPDHSVFVSDSGTGEVYRLKLSRRKLERFVGTGSLLSAQGMVVTRNGRALIVADYATGLHQIELSTGEDRLLPNSAQAALVGIDGLVRCGGALFATQNGTDPERILRIDLDGPEDRITAVNVLAQDIPAVQSITLGTCANGKFVYVAHSQWDAFDEKGRRIPKPLQAPAIMELDADKN